MGCGVLGFWADPINEPLMESGDRLSSARHEAVALSLMSTIKDVLLSPCSLER